MHRVAEIVGNVATPDLVGHGLAVARHLHILEDAHHVGRRVYERAVEVEQDGIEVAVDHHVGPLTWRDACSASGN